MKKKKQEMSILSNNAGVTTVEIMLIGCFNCSCYHFQRTDNQFSEQALDVHKWRCKKILLKMKSA